MKAFTRAEIRDYDRRAIDRGVPGVVLMENAGRGAADVLESLGIHGVVIVLCGKGNNGGDGFVLARQLQSRGYSVQLELAVPMGAWSGDAAVMFQTLNGLGLTVRVFDGNQQALAERLSNCEWIVDALLGTGLQGPVRSPYSEIIATLNGAQKKVLALDLPSGMNCDTGLSEGEMVRADHTVTFVGPKVGMLVPSAVSHVGVIHIVDIGAGHEVEPNFTSVKIP